MRFTVMAAERAPIMATMMQRCCRSAGQECAVTRAASSAPVSANGRANTECSNLIISRTVRMRLGLIQGALLLPEFSLSAGILSLDGGSRQSQETQSGVAATSGPILGGSQVNKLLDGTSESFTFCATSNHGI